MIRTSNVTTTRRQGLQPRAISIVIPAFNEEKRLPRTLLQIQEYLSRRSFLAEVIVVDDGSADATCKVVQQFIPNFPELRLISNGRNRGKGFSVRHGVLESRNEVVLFTDADLSAPIEEADKLFDVLWTREFEIAIGSRAVDRSLIEVRQSHLREFAGIVFNRVVRLLTNTSFEDTQCGFKAFRRETLPAIFGQQRIDGFGFDPEILFLAHRAGFRVAEIPVRWAHDPATKVNVVTDSVRMIRDLIKIRLFALRGLYQQPEVRKWQNCRTWINEAETPHTEAVPQLVLSKK